MPYYAITHLTTFSYSDTITDSVMEVRLQPRSDEFQNGIRFELKISPKARAFSYRDYLNNIVHQFDIPGRHRRLAVRAESVVETRPGVMVPDSLSPDAWDELATALEDRDLFDMILPSHFARPSEILDAFIEQSGIRRMADPLTTLLSINRTMYASFSYEANVTNVDSPIEHALLEGKGVCQDFSHIMTTIVRGMGIPCRYVSGYLFYRADRPERSAVDESHAWVEAWLPGLGWIGFDPTNNLICGDRHIRVGVGRDYDDVPPTKGVFLGDADTKLDVSVKVSKVDEVPDDGQQHAPEMPLPQYEMLQYQQEQQQQ